MRGHPRHTRTRRIEDILLELDRRTGYLDSFTHLGSGRAIPRDDWEERTALFSAILAKGFNHGMATLANSIEGMTSWKIERAAEQYLREDDPGGGRQTRRLSAHAGNFAGLGGGEDLEHRWAQVPGRW